MSDDLDPIEEQCIQFGDDLDRLVKRYAEEYDLPAAAICGLLSFKAHTIMARLYEICRKKEED